MESKMQCNGFCHGASDRLLPLLLSAFRRSVPTPTQQLDLPHRLPFPSGYMPVTSSEGSLRLFIVFGALFIMRPLGSVLPRLGRAMGVSGGCRSVTTGCYSSTTRLAYAMEVLCDIGRWA